MPLLAARSLYEVAEGVVTPPVEQPLVAGGRSWYWPQEVTVQLVGVAATPAVGAITTSAKVTLEELARAFPFPQPEEAPKRIKRLVEPRPVEVPVPVTVTVGLSGVKGTAMVGNGTVKRVFDLLDEEILILMEAA